MRKISCLSILPGALLLLPILLPGCRRAAQWQQREGAVWNTVYHITYRAPLPLDDSIEACFRMVDASLSPFNPSSLISRINRNESARADSLIAKMLRMSQDVCRSSSGRFDPTVSPLINLWRFGYTGKSTDAENWEPTQQQIDSALQYVGILDCNITSDGTLTKKAPETTFNFSAITKGYACDLIAEMMMRNGVEDAMVEIGGEVRVIGHNPSGTPWRLQVDFPTPQAEGEAPQHRRLDVIEVTDCGVATSGNYRNFHESKSLGDIGHTIDPRTGYPARSELLSATVIAPTCAEADAYATAAMACPTLSDALKLLSPKEFINSPASQSAHKPRSSQTSHNSNPSQTGALRAILVFKSSDTIAVKKINLP